MKRWKSGRVHDMKKNAPETVRSKLSEAEETEIISVCFAKEFADLTPYEIYVILLDRMIYIASISTMYRVLRKHNLVHFRGNTKKTRDRYRPPELQADGINLIWAWDVTYMETSVAGIYYYLYTVINLWSRKIVGWCISECENYSVSEQLFTLTMNRLNLESVHLHSDNGNPMKAGTMPATLYKLGIVPSFSCPRQSNDNAYIESFFHTLKYMKDYPKYFDSIEKVNNRAADFINWYNAGHIHSAIGYVTPEQRYTGKAVLIIAKRNAVKRAAFEVKRIRWSKQFTPPENPEAVYLNRMPDVYTKVS
jgi:transposase InsO family protein